MIQANELRIGNYVYYKNTKDFAKVELIHNNHFDCRDEYGSFTPNGSYEPIELTEEMLLKCGFVLSKYKTVFILELNNDEFKTSVQVNKNEETYYLCKKGLIFHGLNIKYLHQLQNLYFALTGKELETI